MELGKKWNKLKRYYHKRTPSILVVNGFWIVFIGLWMFIGGFHNFDSAQNFRYMEMWFNGLLAENNMDIRIDSFDETLGGNFVTPEEGYISGVRLLFLGFLVSLFGMQIFIIGLATYEKRLGNLK